MRTPRLACLLALLAACGGGSTTPDAASSGTDAFSPSVDARGGGSDAPLSPTDDAFTSATDDVFVSADARSAGDAACMLPTTDLTELGSDCSEMACPEGLECIEYSGIVLQHYCGIRCEVVNGGDCACPAPLVCETVSDKTGPRRECVRADI